LNVTSPQVSSAALSGVQWRAAAARIDGPLSPEALQRIYTTIIQEMKGLE